MIATQIQAGLPVYCSNNVEVGTVERLEGEELLELQKDDYGRVHWLPVSWVAEVRDDAVVLDRPVQQVQREWLLTLPGAIYRSPLTGQGAVD